MRCITMVRFEMMPQRTGVLWLVSLTALIACGRSAGAETAKPESSAPMAAATGVTRADGGKGPREHRLIPLRPMSGDVEILYGDPDAAGEPFVMRIRELPGTIVPPHSHPVDEHITILKGTWYFGLGEEFDRARLEELKPGSYAFAPKGASMFGYAPEEVIVQVHGIGPFEIRWHGGLRTLDDPDAKTAFRFARGQQIGSPRGTGRIVEGYGSGRIIQYEIERAEGGRFMVNEDEIRTR